MNDIMVNRYPYDTDISITGVGEEECQTAIETFEKAISDNKVPVDKKAEEIYFTDRAAQGAKGISMLEGHCVGCKTVQKAWKMV